MVFRRHRECESRQFTTFECGSQSSSNVSRELASWPRDHGSPDATSNTVATQARLSALPIPLSIWPTFRLRFATLNTNELVGVFQQAASHGAASQQIGILIS